MERPTSSTVSTVTLVLAAIFGVGLNVAGFLFPLYATQKVSSSGKVVQGSATLVDENDPGVVVVLGVRLLVALVVAAALSRRARPAAALAGTLVGLLAVFTLLAMMSIGLFILPVTVALVVACASAPRPSRDPSLRRLTPPVQPDGPPDWFWQGLLPNGGARPLRTHPHSHW